MLKDELQELCFISTQSVSVGNHNFVDHALDDLFQNGLQVFLLSADVLADCVMEELCVHGYKQLRLLGGAADSGGEEIFLFFLLG